MNDFEKLSLALEGIYVGEIRQLAPILVDEVKRLTSEVERLLAEFGWRDATRKRGDALVSQTFADIRSALGDVEQDVPNWDGSSVGLAAAVGNKVKRLEAENAGLRAEDARMRLACSRENEEICQVLGLALGYPRFCDDQKNFPGATETNGCCTGEHVAVTLAMEAAERIGGLAAENERLRLERDAAIYREIYPGNEDVSWLVLDGATYHGERCGPFPSQVAAFDSVLSWVKYGLDPANHPMPSTAFEEEDT